MGEQTVDQIVKCVKGVKGVTWGDGAVPHGAGAVAAGGRDERRERHSAAGVQPPAGRALRRPGMGGAPGRRDGAADELALLLPRRRRQGAAGRRLDGRTARLDRQPSRRPKSPATVRACLKSSSRGNEALTSSARWLGRRPLSNGRTAPEAQRQRRQEMSLLARGGDGLLQRREVPPLV